MASAPQRTVTSRSRPRSSSRAGFKMFVHEVDQVALVDQFHVVRRVEGAHQSVPFATKYGRQILCAMCHCAGSR